MTRYDYFYDAQMKRFIDQIVRAFSGLQYATGKTVGGQPELRTVPCRPATMNKMVASLMQHAGNNTLLAVPLITVARTGLARKPEIDGNHTFRGSVQVAERARDENGRYLEGRGQSYTIERLMPVPFEMTIQIDIWTSNMDQKDQILEQILMMAGREIDIQNSDNAVDWSALTTMRLTDISLSSRSFPVGSDDDIDFATLTYSLPFHLNPPAKVTRQVLIQKVVNNVGAGETVETASPYVQSVVTPSDYRIQILKGVITLLDTRNKPVPWSALQDTYHTAIATGQTQLRVRKGEQEDAPEIIGIVHVTDVDEELEWQVDIDTLPTNTLPPVNALIKPLNHAPGRELPEAQAGQRYLVVQDIGTSETWGTVNARANDIIEFRNGQWTVVMAANTTQHAIVLNLSSGTQLQWDGHDWLKAIDGVYNGGSWRIFT